MVDDENSPWITSNLRDKKKLNKLFLWGLSNTAWKVSKYGVFSGPYFPVFGVNTENTGICRPEITPYLEIFHAVQNMAK